MCLGVPARVVEVLEEDGGIPMGRVSFDGVVKEVCLAYTPDVEPGDYVIVHVGFAIARLDAAEASRQLEALAAMDGVASSPGSSPADGGPGRAPARPGEEPGE